MAEVLSSQAIVKQGEYNLTVKDIDNTGKTIEITLPMASDSDFNKWHLVLRAAILKKTTWAKFSIPEIIHAIIYADRMGLDIIAGDVYTADGGRLSTTAKAKIRHAMASGRIEGYEVELEGGEDIEIPWETKSQKGTWAGKNTRAKVMVYVKGFKVPVVYTTTLKEWFKGDNPNWRQRPEYMLRMNALSKALEEVAPMGTEADEAPPVIEVPKLTTIAEAVKSAGNGGK